MAVAGNPTATARARSAVESAPPDTAQVAVVPGGKEQRARSGAATRARAAASGDGRVDTHPAQPALGRPDLLHGGEVGGPLPAAVDGHRPGGRLDSGDEPLTGLVLGQLGLDAEESLHDPRQTVLVATALA